MAHNSFADHSGMIWMDGALRPWKECQVHMLTHAMHYGSSVFEGQRAYNGKIFKLEEHTARLFASAEILGMKIPFTEQQINDACNEVMKVNGFVDAYCRPIAWRGSEMMGVSAQKNTIHVAIAMWGGLAISHQRHA